MITVSDKGIVMIFIVLFFAGVIISAHIDDRIKRRKRSEQNIKDFHARQRLRDNTKYYNFGENEIKK